MPTRILIADDEPVILDIVREFLQSENCEVISCEDGGEAILRAQQHNPDLVLMDLMMDSVDGLFALKELKRNERTKHIPVVILTAVKANGAIGQECLEAGAFAVIEKPIDFKKLRKVVFQVVPIQGVNEEDEDEESKSLETNSLDLLTTIGLTEEKLDALFSQDDV